MTILIILDKFLQIVHKLKEKLGLLKKHNYFTSFLKAVCESSEMTDYIFLKQLAHLNF